jgi:hypothetical protein
MSDLVNEAQGELQQHCPNLANFVSDQTYLFGRVLSGQASTREDCKAVFEAGTAVAIAGAGAAVFAEGAIVAVPIGVIISGFGFVGAGGDPFK